jgi:asparagine synthase (glutamine-hydrolysing)
MCGIFGYANWNKNQKLDEKKLISAANLLFHRGPDGGAYYTESGFFIAHRRLSIIDIQGGEQPIFSEDGRFGITFNGEIYNFIELKEELGKLGHRFQTKSDTEVLLKGYMEWGQNVCEKLIGMFAFAIHDRLNQTLFLARDRLGEKPLFYFYKDNTFAFASELKSLTFIAPFPLEIDSPSLASYLCLNYVPGTHTLMSNILKLKPGCSMTVSSDGVKIKSYWTPLSNSTSISHPIDKLETLLKESIDIGSRSDVPVTLALSGGIDSSLVGYYAAKQGSLSEAYCVDFQEKGFSEYPQAKIVADKLGIKLNPVPFSSDTLEDFLNVTYSADDPLADSSSLAVWALAQEVSKKYKVMLGGDGGDEIFGGYLTYKATLLYQQIYNRTPQFALSLFQKMASTIPQSEGKVTFSYKLMRFLRAFNLSPEEAHFTWNGTWHPHDANKIMGSEASTHFNSLKDQNVETNDTLTRLQLIDLMNYLPSDILTKVDRMTMAHGLECRAPLLHPSIVEFGLSLDRTEKISKQGQLKHILRKLAEKKFGPSISQAKKQGFSIPVNQWLRKEAKSLLLDSLSNETLAQIPFLNNDFVLKAIQDHMKGKKQLGFELWGLMVLVTWYRQKILNPYYDVRDTKLHKLIPPLKEVA